MKKQSYILILVTLIFTTNIFAQKSADNNTKRWETVNQLAEKQLPESALKEVESMLKQAQKEKNIAETIKALVYKMRFTLEKNPDEAPTLIHDFEIFTENSTDIAEKALLHSMTAELYAQYYQKDSWTINARTEIVVIIPKDMKEWSKNIYFDKIKKHLAASMTNAIILQNTDALKFADLLIKGDESRILQPTLFDLIAYRRISILESLSQFVNSTNPLNDINLFAEIPSFTSIQLDSTVQSFLQNHILKTYQELLHFRTKSKNESALLFADLERLKYINNHWEILENSLYQSALERLEKQFSENEFVVEVLAEIAHGYLNNFYKDKKNTENKKLRMLAHEICSKGISRFPNYKRITILKNLKKEIEAKNINIAYKSVTRPNSNIELEVKSQNVDTLQLSVYKVNATAQEYYNFNQNQFDRKAVYPNRSLVYISQIKTKPSPNFEEINTKIEVKATDFGIYEFTLEEKRNEKNENRVFGTFTTTDLANVERCTEVMKSSNYVLDRQSGTPQSEVKVAVYNRKWTGQGYALTPSNQYITNKNGYCQIDLDKEGLRSNQVIFFQKENDSYYSSASYSYFPILQDRVDTTTTVSIFTDRSIYRPGQTVYFKAIAYCSKKQKQEVMDGVGFDFSLMDSNWEPISKKSLKTNAFGSVSGEFTLPTTGLNGNYGIKCGNFNLSFSVEEYKRPTFEVKIKKPKTEVSFGEEVVLKGDVKAFAGYGIGNAKVKYRILRSSHRYCWWCNEVKKELINGITTAKIDGRFEIKFTPDKTESIQTDSRNEQIYTYTLLVDVTDTKGETQQGEQRFSVGEKSLFILSNIAKKIDKHRALSIPIRTENLNGELVNSNIEYRLISLENSDIYDEKLNDKKVLKELKTLMSGNYSSQNKNLDLDLSKLSSGGYKIVFTTKDSKSREVKTEHYFILYDWKDSQPAIKSYVWLLSSNTECKVGEKAKIKFGTSTKNGTVLYEIMHGDTTLESRWISFSNEIKTFEIPFKTSYGSGAHVQFTFMKDEELFTETVELKQKVAEKKLTPTLSIFRDKLQPGEKAEWTITVPESAKGKHAAELMVGMYDASLDKLYPHSWSFNPIINLPILHSPIWAHENFGRNSDQVSISEQIENLIGFQLNQLYWFGLELDKEMIKGRGRLMSKSFVTDGIALSDLKTNDGIVDNNNNAIEKPQIIEIPIHLRTNFNETVFFYPQLRTDSMGNVKFSFTVPESLTRWNVKMLAHTKDLYFGQGEAQVVTQKDLMVQMNLPRFVRRSDKVVLSANVINLTDKELNANVKFELIDPATEKPIQLKDATTRKVILAPNETKTVEWEITEFSPYELVTCKVIAQAGDFSDGEQKYLPILPDKVLVTESMPLVLRGNETRTYNFENLLQNGSKVENKSLTVEFSSNPTWYAIQALPTLTAPASDNAFDYLTAYYANRLAGYIANSNPKIKTVIEQWKQKGGNQEALLSNLEKNSELKNTLMEETPWLMAAKNETEQKHQIALLFDLNQQESQAQQYLDKLKTLQLPSGGFAWFKGMTESRYITQTILLDLGRLKKMVNGQWSTDIGKQIVINALAYLDLEIAKDFENLKKQNKNYERESSIDNTQLFYLHLRSEFPEIAIAASAKEAVNFYTKQSEKQWTSFSLYGKAMMAVEAQRNGKIELANNILKSLKENALKSDELGMYWAKNQAGYFWNERPIAVQTSMIEAFAEVSKNQNDVEELKIWLLKQKQTQYWDSPLSTVDAVYALINYGSDWLKSDGKVNIKLGSAEIKSQSSEAGTGYFKQTIPTAEIQTTMGKVTISNQIQSTNSEKNSSIGWGAMYWQYYQSLEKITQQNGSLSISKKLYLEKMSNQAKQLVPIEQTVINKGDKVITRLVISTDRDLDFVALKDLRAACFEPVEQISGCFWKEGVSYYKTSKDASTQFFFSYLPKGTYVFEYELWANSTGNYSSGMASLQCLYAPEFISHSSGERMVVK